MRPACCLIFALFVHGSVFADDKLDAAVQRGLAVVQKAAASYPKHRQCFSCHHQTLPMLAIVAARDNTPVIADQTLLKTQAEFTSQSFQARVQDMKQGQGIGGRSMTVGYGLWALDLAKSKPDETTEAMVAYLLKNQSPDGSWQRQASRPPLEESHIMCTVLAAYYLPRFATEPQRTDVDRAVAKGKTWLEKVDAGSMEDKSAKLWGLHLLECDPAAVSNARKIVIENQRDDGGWSQLPTMKSDAYATGQALFILRDTGTSVTEPAYQRGADFLLRTQLPDGSWLVETRSRPIQVFFDNGDPHGKHQFISTPATSWAVAALAFKRPKAQSRPPEP